MLKFRRFQRSPFFHLFKRTLNSKSSRPVHRTMHSTQSVEKVIYIFVIENWKLKIIHIIRINDVGGCLRVYYFSANTLSLSFVSLTRREGVILNFGRHFILGRYTDISVTFAWPLALPDYCYYIELRDFGSIIRENAFWSRSVPPFGYEVKCGKDETISTRSTIPVQSMIYMSASHWRTRFILIVTGK